MIFNYYTWRFLHILPFRRYSQFSPTIHDADGKVWNCIMFSHWNEQTSSFTHHPNRIFIIKDEVYKDGQVYFTLRQDIKPKLKVKGQNSIKIEYETNVK